MTATDKDILAAEPDARIYRVLGKQFLDRPTRQRIDAVGRWANEWRQRAESPPPDLNDALTLISDGAQTDEKELRRAFTHLFRGISEHKGLKPPYESLYRNERLYGPTTREIQRGYRHAGFEVTTDDWNEIPDHLGIELQFLGELLVVDNSDHELSQGQIEDAVQWMLKDHLIQWMPIYQSHLHQEGPPDYYAGLIDLTLIVVKRHHKLFMNRQNEDD